LRLWLIRFNESFLSNLLPTCWTLPRLTENVICEFASMTCDAIENPIEGDLRIRIAVSAGVDEFKSPAYRVDVKP